MPNGLAQRLTRPLVRFVLRHWVRHEETIRIRQQLRYLALAQLLSRSESRPIDLTLFELSLFSQNGEDGVLVEILRRIGEGSKCFVEIGASVNEANCLFLADAYHWSGVFVEADIDEYRGLAHKYSGIPRVQVVQLHVTKDNFQGFLTSANIPTNFDVLSIDIDGNDYWLWESLAESRPRVIIIEYNSGLDPNRQLVQPYQPHRAWDGTSYYGASLGALLRLANQRGYQLVHVDLTGTNAFFVRSDAAGTSFQPENEVIAKGANHFLYGLHYKDVPTSRAYLDLSRNDDPK